MYEAVGAPGLLIEVFEDVLHDVPHPSRVHHCLLGLDGRDLFVDDVPHLDGVHVVDPERQDILVVNGIHDRVGVQFLAERLLGSLQTRAPTSRTVLREDRRAGEPEQVEVLE